MQTQTSGLTQAMESSSAVGMNTSSLGMQLKQLNEERTQICLITVDACQESEVYHPTFIKRLSFVFQSYVALFGWLSVGWVFE